MRNAEKEGECIGDVGCRKPHVAMRFRKGQSGNPKGRPRMGKVKQLGTIVLEEVYRLIPVEENGKTFKMPAIQIIIRNQFAQALKGDVQAQQTLVKLMSFAELELPGPPEPVEESESREASLNRKAEKAEMVKRFMAQWPLAFNSWIVSENSGQDHAH